MANMSAFQANDASSILAARTKMNHLRRQNLSGVFCYNRDMQRILTLEYAILALLVAVAFIVSGFDWWWLFVLFLAVDVSMVGYLVNPRVGAAIYNIGHSVIGPAILLGIFLFHGQPWELFVGLIWLFHLFVDRALGYGLKHSDAFTHTHFGRIGKKP